MMVRWSGEHQGMPKLKVTTAAAYTIFMEDVKILKDPRPSLSYTSDHLKKEELVNLRGNQSLKVLVGIFSTK